MIEKLGLSMISRFIDQEVTVNTLIGPFRGTLRKADSSQHSGIGNLLLETWEGQLLLTVVDNHQKEVKCIDNL